MYKLADISVFESLSRQSGTGFVTNRQGTVPSSPNDSIAIKRTAALLLEDRDYNTLRKSCIEFQDTLADLINPNEYSKRRTPLPIPLYLTELKEQILRNIQNLQTKLYEEMSDAIKAHYPEPGSYWFSDVMD